MSWKLSKKIKTDFGGETENETVLNFISSLETSERNNRETKREKPLEGCFCLKFCASDGEWMTHQTLFDEQIDEKSVVLPNEGKMIDGEIFVENNNHANNGERNVFPTPLAHIAKETGCPSEWRREAKQLGTMMAERATMQQLTPDWTEWLMGFPIGWTSIEPMKKEQLDAWAQSKPTRWFESDFGIPTAVKHFKHRRDRLTSLGNAQVPFTAQKAFETLSEKLK